MNTLILAAGAAALAITAPALANPGHGHGNQGNAHAQMAQAKSHGDARHGSRTLTTRQGRLYALGARASCPPGLAKKHNGCMPPGQAKKFNRGQRWQNGYGSRYTYRQIPYDLRQRYDLNPYDRYYYNNGYLYRVDPRTMLIEQVISALLR